MWIKLRLILWKNLLIRRRHWLLTTVEILLPILLFTLVAYGRSKISGMNKIEKNATYSDFAGVDEIDAHLPVGGFNLWYAPYTEFTEAIMRKVQEKFQIPGQDIKEFTSEENLREHFTRNSSGTIGSVIFRTNDHTKLNYDISFHDKYLTWNTDKRFISMFGEEEISDSSKYLYKGFAALQVAINTAFMEMFLKKDQLSFSFFIQEFPYPPHTFDSGFNQLFIYFLPLVTIFSFVFLCPAVLKRVGEEKQSGTKEYLKMVGMNSGLIWFGWLIHALTSNLISIIAIVILMKVPFWGVPYPPIEHSDGAVLFLFLFLYCMAAITFCFLIATVISTPSIASVTGILIWIFSYFIPQALVGSNENMIWMYKIAFAIFPNMALHYGYSAIAMYEMREIGIQWNNIFESGSGSESDVTMGDVFFSLFFEMVVFMLLTLYIENVRPGEYGIAKPLSFPFLDLINWVKSFSTSKVGTHIELLQQSCTDELLPQSCINIVNLKKKFYKTVAVDNLTMNVYSNRITVLLGHNGAGKSTTMSLLTGMMSPTEGYIFIDGKDIGKHTNEVRKNLGLCTQHNLLFPDLTAMEHLLFFGMLKRKRSCDIKKLAREMLQKFNIMENAMPHELSGGMKRKLCLGMALIGDAEVLILDEPTSGMDPESRRVVWNMLLQNKEKKTILISTHFMEEADILGDQIAIMANGRLQCYDTPLNLKKQFNTGYHLSLVLNSSASLQKIESVIQKEICDARLLRDNGGNLVYLLPLDQKLQYANLFSKLEPKKEEWGIDSMGLSITTLSDVFLKARDKNGTDETDEGKYKDEDKDRIPNRNWWKIWISLLLKRWYFFKRKFYWYIPAVVVTISIFLIAMWLGTANTEFYNYGGPKLNLSLSIYGKTGVIYGSKEGTSSQLVSTMKKHYHKIALDEEGEPIQAEDVSKAIIQKGIDNIAFYKRHMIAAAEFNTSSDENAVIVNAMYSSSALHGLPIAINLAMNAVVKSLLNDSFSISVRNVPLKPLYTDFSPAELSVISTGILWLILVPTGMLFLMSNFIVFPNIELSSKFLRIQNIAGVKTYVYWLSNIVFDFIFYLFKLIILFLMIKLMDMLAFDSLLFGTRELQTLIIMFVCYGISTLPFIYLFSYCKTISGGFTRLVMIGIFTGIAPTIAIRAMELSDDRNYMEIAQHLKYVLLCFCPQFTLHYISVKFAQKYVENFNWVYMNPSKKKHICEVQPTPCCKGDDTWECSLYQNYFKNDELGIQKDLFEMLASFGVYFLLLCFLNTELCERLWSFVRYFPCYVCCGQSDVGKSKPNTAGLKLYTDNLTKSFGAKRIVKQLNLQLKKNKCFGLLGENGAGKSTTFRMLTKSTFKDKGKIAIEDGGKEHTIGQDTYSEQIGYCPQDDCLNFFLTGRELLHAVALMKGYTIKESNNLAGSLLRKFDLEEYADKQCLDYSGGNKRKLNTCIAFLGSPKVIMLDEPTSGVDPASRRNFWDILSKYKKKDDKSLLLCSHSMEECEALCDEIGIMKNGSITKKGTLSHLKNEHEKGYIIDVKLKNITNNRDTIIQEIQQKTEANYKDDESYSDSLKFHTTEKVTLSTLFTTMEELKNNCSKFIDDYIISQVSLEDIFLSVAKEKIKDENSDGKTVRSCFNLFKWKKNINNDPSNV